MTFDERGASGHPNHAACFRGVALLREEARGERGPCVTTWLALETAPLARRFVGALDVARPRFDRRPGLLFWTADVPGAYAALGAHASQVVWFRRLFLLFSVYTWVNRLVVME